MAVLALLDEKKMLKKRKALRVFFFFLFSVEINEGTTKLRDEKRERTDWTSINVLKFEYLNKLFMT